MHGDAHTHTQTHTHNTHTRPHHSKGLKYKASVDIRLLDNNISSYYLASFINIITLPVRETSYHILLLDFACTNSSIAAKQRQDIRYFLPYMHYILVNNCPCWNMRRIIINLHKHFLSQEHKEALLSTWLCYTQSAEDVEWLILTLEVTKYLSNERMISCKEMILPKINLTQNTQAHLQLNWRGRLQVLVF